MVEKTKDNKVEEKKVDGNKDEEKIVIYLSNLSSRLKKMKDRDEKVQALVELNDYLNKYGETIEKLCPEKLVSILNSL